MLRTYSTCNPTVEFSKYKFINKLLCGVTLFYIYIYIYNPINQTLYAHAMHDLINILYIDWNYIRLDKKFMMQIRVSMWCHLHFMISVMLSFKITRVVFGRGSCTYISGGSNEPPDLKYIYIYIYIYCFTNLILLKIFLHPSF